MMPMSYRLDYVPTARQELFHRSEADEALYGGAAGGGKSCAVVMEAFTRCWEHAGTHAYLFRRTLRELDDTLLQEALHRIPRELYHYSAAAHDLWLPNGSVMRFRYCAAEQDALRYQGAEIHWLFIDELTHFSKATYDFLKTRLRARTRLGIKPVARLTSNPGGPGHSWVKAYFVDTGKPDELVTRQVESRLLGGQQRRTVQYIPARPTDNPHISAEYIYELEQKPSALRAALLHGRWDAFEGQAFPEFADRGEGGGSGGAFTHVIEPFDIPEDWPRYRSFDFGYAKPFSVGWWAVDGEGRIIRYREWYGASAPNAGLRLDPREIARGIREAEAAAGERRVIGIADPSIWDASRGESIAEQMAREGVHFLPGDNARLAGKMQLHHRLKFDEEGRAMLAVTRDCRAFIRTIPALAYDPARVEDVDTRGEDHVYDETRYMLMDRPIGARKKHSGIPVYDPLA